MIQNVKTTNASPPRVLFDTLSDTTLYNFKSLPKGIVPRRVQGQRTTRVHGLKELNREVLIDRVCLPEFSPTQRIVGPIRCKVYDNPESSYDLIVGQDVLQLLKIKIDCDTKTVTWNNNMIPFHPTDYFEQSDVLEAMALEADDPLEEEYAKEAGYKSNVILHSKYESVDPLDVARQQKHLTKRQQDDLAKVLSRFDKLFSGKLGCYPYHKVHLDLKPDAKPYTCRPYPVPRHHQRVFKDELDRLCKEGVLSRCGASAWLFPNFLIP